MNLDKDLALLLMFSAAYMFEDCNDEDVCGKLIALFERKGFNLDQDFSEEFAEQYLLGGTESKAVDWLESTIDRIQSCIETRYP